jgi:hypothetical protein
MPLDSTLFRNPRILLVPGSDGYAAYHTDTGRIHRLNASAALILELFDGTRTVLQSGGSITQFRKVFCPAFPNRANRFGLFRLPQPPNARRGCVMKDRFLPPTRASITYPR